MRHVGKTPSQIGWSLFVLLSCVIIGGSLLGIKGYAVTSGSMEPSLPVGSMVLVNSNHPLKDVSVGDIICFQVNDTAVVTHRVIEIDREHLVFTTKGDANDAQDAAPVTAENYIGTVSIHLNGLGYAAQFTKDNLVALLLLALVLDVAITLGIKAWSRRNI